jgi:hypothetical protein
MSEISAISKVVLAVVLVVAAGAKLADIGAFGDVIRSFAAGQLSFRMARCVAVAIAVLELTLGGASLLAPKVTVLNWAVFLLAIGFVFVSAFGYAFRRGRPCRCFGALSKTQYSIGGIIRSCLLGAASALAALIALPAGWLNINALESALVLVLVVLLVLLAATAARAIGEADEARSMVGTA